MQRTERGEAMSDVDHKPRASKEQSILRIRRGIRAAQLRVTLYGIRGRRTPEAVVRLSRLTPPAAAVTLRYVENARWKAPEGSGGSEGICSLFAPDDPGRAAKGCPGRAAGPADARGRKATGPEKASITRLKTRVPPTGTIGPPPRRAWKHLHVGVGLRNLHQKCTTKPPRMQKTPGFPGVFLGGDGGI